MPRKRPVAVATSVPEKKMRPSEVVDADVAAAGADTARTNPFGNALAQEVCVSPATPASSRSNILPVWRHEAMPAELPDARKEMAPEEVHRLMNAIGSKVIKDLRRFVRRGTATHRALASFARSTDTAKELHMHDPLNSYQAAWKGEEAAISLRKFGLYEAAASITWLNPFPEDEVAQEISGDPPKWSDIVRLADAFTLDVDQSPEGLTRFIFPIVLPVHLSSVDAAKVRSSAGMSVVCGGVYVFAWCVRMYRAMVKRDALSVASLWLMGLATSVQARHSLTQRALALWSLQRSENLCRAPKGALAEAFPAFALKRLRCLRDSTTLTEVEAAKSLSGMGVRFHGKPANTSMASAVLLFRTVVDQKCLALLRKIETLDAPGAQDIFSTDYQTFSRVVQACQEAAMFIDDPVPDLLYFVLGAMEFALRFEELKSSDLAMRKRSTSRGGTPPTPPWCAPSWGGAPFTSICTR